MQGFGLARLGRDAELRTTPGGDQVARLSLAFSYGRKGEDGKRPTTWVEASFWGARAAALAPYLTKGSQIAVTLEEVHIEAYQSNGVERTKLAARVASIDLAGGNQQPAARAPAPAPRPPAPAPRQGGGSAPAARQFEHDGMNSPNEACNARGSSGFEDLDPDAIPF